MYFILPFNTFSCSSLKVTFVAVRGESYLGDIALDEIAVNEVDECKVLKETKYSAKDVARNPKEGGCG